MVFIVDHFEMRLGMRCRHLSSCIGEMYCLGLLRAYSEIYSTTNAW